MPRWLRPLIISTSSNSPGLVLAISGSVSKELSMDRGVDGPDSKLLKFIGRKTMFSKEVVTHVTCRVDISGVIDVTIRVEVRPSDLVRLGIFTHEKSAKNLVNYLKTKFVRFLVSQLSFSQDITKDRFLYVPVQNYTENWTDEKLYKKYSLTKEEIDFIESMIRPME